MKRIILSLLLTLSLTLSLLPAVNAAGIPGEEKLPDEAGYGKGPSYIDANVAYCPSIDPQTGQRIMRSTSSFLIF